MKVMEWCKDARKLTKSINEYQKLQNEYNKKYFSRIYKEQQRASWIIIGTIYGVMGLIVAIWIGIGKLIEKIQDLRFEKKRNQEE